MRMHRREFIHLVTGAAITAGLTPFSASTALAADKTNASGPATPKRIKRFGDGRDWFFEKRFGMFVHWGLYAIPAWHEQHQWRARVPRAEFMQLARQWNPVKFNPNAWLDLMEAAGMKYICVTTKHHDGFCLWDTQADLLQHHEHALRARHHQNARRRLP